MAVTYAGLSFAAFQRDGIFIGTTGTRERNASVASCIVFLGLLKPLIGAYANTGLWIAFILYVVARGIALGLYYPSLRRTSTPI